MPDQFSDLIEKLGPNFDYGALERALNTTEGMQLPEAVKTNIRAAANAGQRARVKVQNPVMPSDAATIAAQGPGDIARIPGRVLNTYTAGVKQDFQLGIRAPWQFASDFTAGLIPKPDVSGLDASAQAEWNSTVKPLVALTAVTAQVWAATGILSYASKTPVVSRVLEQLPARLKAIGAGAAIGAATEAARPEEFMYGDQKASPIDVPAWMGQKVQDLTGLGPRAGLAVGGAVFGGAAGEVIGGIVSGMQKLRSNAIVRAMDEPTITSMREALQKAGVPIVEGEDKFAVAEKFTKNIRKVMLNEGLAGMVSERLAREDYILSELLGSAKTAQAGAAATPVEEETGRLVAGIFRTNPGGTVIIRNVSDPSLVHWEMPRPKRAGDVSPFPLTGKKLPVFGGKVQLDEGLINRPKDSGLIESLVDAVIPLKVVSSPAGMAKGMRPGESALPSWFQQQLVDLMWNPTATNRDVIEVVNDFQAMHGGWEGADVVEGILKKYARPKAPGSSMAGMPEWSEWTKSRVGRMPGLVPGPNQTLMTNLAADEKYIISRNTRATASNEGPWRATRFADAGNPNPTGHVWFNTQAEAEAYVKNKGFAQTPRSEAARQIKQTGLVFDAEKKLGMRLDVHTIRRSGFPGPDTFDVLVSRPVYEFPFAEKLGKLNAKVTNQLKVLARETALSIRAPKTTEAFILSDGTPIRGGLSTGVLEKKLHLQAPIVEGSPRADLALRSAAQPVRIEVVGPKELVIELPQKLTQEQFNAIGRSVDAVKMDKITISAGGKERELLSPLGGQIQDVIADMTKPLSVKSVLTEDVKNQFNKNGFFKGQAAVMPDGTAAEVLGGMGGKPGSRLIRIRDTLTNEERVISEKNLTLLPTTLNSELQPSQMFTQYMTEAEREALAKMRISVTKGWAKEITKARDLKDFGNSRGFLVNALRGGKFELTKINDGGADAILFPNLKSAVEFIRADQSALPDLTPESIKNLLGENLNMGWAGGGGHPPLQNEMIPMDWPSLERAIESLDPTRGITLWDAAIRPTKALMERIDSRYNLQFTRVFDNVSSSMVGNQNFISLWYGGKGGRLPDGVKPLNNIFQSAGHNANWELVTDFRESVKGSPESQAIWASMTKGEQQAATDLGKWYDAAYTHFGVEAQFVENYMPHFRELAERGNGTDIKTLWRLLGGDPLKPPKGMDWVNEMVREGNMDIYEKDARKVATMYLRGAGHTRFMKESYDQAREVVQMVASKNKLLGATMGHFLQAVRGTEFPEQRAILGETFKRILEKLPGEKTAQSASAAERLVDLLTGAVYSSTMGFRPSLAFRNASSAIVMVWPVFGGNGRFNEALLRAMTLAGKDEAAAARAINHAQGARFAQTEVDEAIREVLPRRLQELNEVGMGLYDSADQFTRAVAYHAARMRAEDAILAFSKKVNSSTPLAKVEEAKRQLLIDSRIYLQDKQISDEFLRRVGTNPELAAQFAGKQGSDITNFLYGRGMQAQWMRSVGGRLFGQFGTWPMWYIDYMRRMVGRAGTAGFRAEGMKLLAKHALVNAAILATGKELLDVDLSRWASYGSVFWSGGPGFQIASGASTLMRGLGSVTSGNEDPLAQSRISEGLATIWQTMPTYVPFWYGGRDAIRLLGAENSTEFLASVMGTQPTREFQFQDRMDRLLGVNRQPFTSSSPALEDLLNAKAAGKAVLDIRGLSGQLPKPPMSQPQAGTPGSQSASSSASASVSMPANTPPDIRANLMNEVKKSAESKPIGNF